MPSFPVPYSAEFSGTDADVARVEQIFHRHLDAVWRAARTLGVAPRDQEDVVQEVFALIWKNRLKLGEIENLDAYIFRMAQNRAINAFRKTARETLVLSELKQALPSPVSAEQVLEARDLEKTIRSLVDRLPAQQKLVYTLSREQGLKHHEIADQLNISPGTVKNHMIQAELQLTREPLPLPRLLIKRKPESLFDYRFEDFELLDYYAHGSIKAPIAV